jgi:hypothetical protein
MNVLADIFSQTSQAGERSASLNSRWPQVCGVKRVEGLRKTAGRTTRKRQSNHQHLVYSSNRRHEKYIYYLTDESNVSDVIDTDTLK